MKLPFGLKLEKRSSSNYTTQQLATHLIAARGGPAVIGNSSVARFAGDLYGRCLATATWSPEDPVLTAPLMYRIGQALIRDGRYLALIEVDSSGITLTEPSQVETYGSIPRRSGWQYRIEMPTPGGQGATITAIADEMIVIDWATAGPDQPWRAVGPLETAEAELQANLAVSLGNEAGMAQGQLLNIPTSGDADEDSESLHEGLKKSKGHTAVLEHEAVVASTGRPIGAPQRFGPEFSSTSPMIMEMAERAVLGACGIPPGLYFGTDGASAREQLRQFLRVSLSGISKVIASELSDKLNLPGLTADFKELNAADIQGMARAAAALVKAGRPIDEAMEEVGF